MAVESWIDAVSDLWAGVDDGQNRKVRSYAVFRKTEFPESITEFPCAITYVTRAPIIQYSSGGPCVTVWQGVSEFHLAAGTGKQFYPYCMRFYNRIIAAAAASITLSGLVSHFLLSSENPLEPGILKYGSEDPHLGVVVNWEVKEIISLTVGA